MVDNRRISVGSESAIKHSAANLYPRAEFPCSPNAVMKEIKDFRTSSSSMEIIPTKCTGNLFHLLEWRKLDKLSIVSEIDPEYVDADCFNQQFNTP